MTEKPRKWIGLLAVVMLANGAAMAQDPKPGDPGYMSPLANVQQLSHFGSSPFDPPEENDQTFVVDQAGGLDTGCTFHSGGPLVFSIKVDRVVGDVAKLKANGMILENAMLRMPAFDVDFDAPVTGFAPERDRIFFNGHLVPTEFLTGSNNVWKLNAFQIPIEWVNFPSDPGPGGTASEGDNEIRIDIDVANVGSGEYWCTAIDWAALTFEVARPVVMAHGIRSSGSVWSETWVPRLNNLGLPNSNNLNMGNLDSIANNASKIAAEVADAKQRWGVDKVVMVAHSKGGLDSRHFVENSNDAEQVIQLGTPNAGSPLADAIQAGSISLVGPVGTAIINAIAGPAGVQLTTPYMAVYNLFHGSNPKVRYTALAGDYDPDCFLLNPFCRPIERALLLITGQGDTIVPISSVHALGYTQNRTFFSSGENNEATHTQLPKSSAVFNTLADRASALGTNALSALPSQLFGHFQTTASVVGLIQQSQIQDYPLPIDEQVQVFIPLFYPSGDLDLVLISPSGQLIDPVFADADPDMSYDEGEMLGGRMAVYNLGLPEPGVWTVRVSAPSVVDPTGEVGYSLAAWLESPAITFRGELAASTVPSGTPLTLFGTVLEAGAPLTGAVVTATLALPDDSRQSVSLLDDGIGMDVTAGDGIYSGVFSATDLSGNYRIVFNAARTGSAVSPDFSRETFALATVSSSSSTFTGTFHDFGVDTDGDSLFNQLVIEADLNITVSADYLVVAELENSAGNVVHANASASLTPGIATVAVNFDGETIFQNGIDGPYTLRIIRIAEEAGLAILPVDDLTDAHQTPAYGFIEFQHAPIGLTGNGSSAGRDTNANGKFDFLDVSIEVLVDKAGFYSWSARLVDVDGTELGFANRSGFFEAGANSFTLSFLGESIGANAIDGPYFVTDLLAFGGGSSLGAAHAFTTDPFLASEFEGFVGDTTAPNLEVVLEPSVLWPPNHRLVEVEALITVTDDTDPTPEIILVSIESDEPDDGTGDGDKPDDIQQADFGTDDREFKLRAERGGGGAGRLYTVTYQAVDDSGNQAEAVANVEVPHDMGK